MKKRVISTLMASAMVWSAMATSVFAGSYDFTAPNDHEADPTEDTGVHGTLSGYGVVDTKDHKQHFRVAIPKDKAQVYDFWVDPNENGEFTAAVTQSKYFNNPTGPNALAKTVYFKRHRTQEWMGVALPNDDVVDVPFSYGLSDKSDFVVVSNIGSVDVIVNASVDKTAGNNDSYLDTYIKAYAFNKSTYDAAIAQGLGATAGWVELKARGEETISTGVDVVVGKLNADPVSTPENETASRPEGKVDYGQWNRVVFTNADKDGDGVAEKVEYDLYDAVVGEKVTGTNVNPDRETLSVRLVREGGNPLPVPNQTYNKTWNTVSHTNYFDDALTKDLKMDLGTLTAVNSIAFQVQANAYGPGWTNNQNAKIVMVWNIQSETAIPPTVKDEYAKNVITFTNNVPDPIDVMIDAGTGVVRAKEEGSVKGLYLMYGYDNNEGVLVDSSLYSATDIINKNDIKITLSSTAIINLFETNKQEVGTWLPALFKVVFNLENGGTTEAYFWVSADEM